MEAEKRKDCTMEDIYALPEGERAELIDGELYMMAPPATRHQRLSFSISRKIADYIDAKQGSCEVIPAPFAVFLYDQNEKENYVEPDISVICDSEKIDEKGCHGAPDWIIEIVSPASRKLDYGRKQALYLSAGVREYWIVDPMRETVIIYRQSEDWAPMLVHFTDKIRSGIYEDLELTIE